MGAAGEKGEGAASWPWASSPLPRPAVLAASQYTYLFPSFHLQSQPFFPESLNLYVGLESDILEGLNVVRHKGYGQ